jgi:NADPH-dependent 2,4-dienoyl-CoA reductase/sulfur reductase-like enzyme
MKLLIVGGVAGGASAATRARRLSEDANIVVIERGPSQVRPTRMSHISGS